MNTQQLDLLLRQYVLYLWLGQGLPVFAPTHSLLAALSLTDPAGVRINELHMPFKTFAVQIPPHFWQTSYQGQSTDVRTLIMSTYISAQHNVPVLYIQLFGGATSLFSIINLEDPERELGDVIDEGTNTDVRKSVFSVDRTDADRALSRAAWFFAVNLCLYVAEHGRGEKLGGHSTKQARRRAPVGGSSQRGKPIVWTLGREVKLDSETLESARQFASDAHEDRAKWRLRSRFTVRGHWRNQAYGSRRELRKRIWIQPFWKGPEEGERIAHLYTSDDDDEPKRNPFDDLY